MPQRGEKYVLREPLGRGASSAVFRALRTSDSATVAAKLIPVPDAGMAASIMDRYRRLMQLAPHPHLVSILDVGIARDTGAVQVIMPLIDGGSLSDRLRQRETWPPPAESARIVRQLGSGLQHLHDHGLVHLDVKPSNVLLSNAAEPLLTDFGISREIALDVQRSAGRVHGTPAYMAPEQCLLQPVGPATDQYALAIVAYVLLTGRLPFVGATPRDILQQQVRRSPPPPTDVCPALPRPVERVLLTGLEKQPRERFPSVTAFAFALEQAVGTAAWAPDATPVQLVPETVPTLDAPTLEVPLLG